MNERLQQLLMQAEKSVVFLSNSKESKLRIMLDTFANLIVEDCIKSLGSQTDQSNLRRKFGIAEPIVEGIGRYYPPADIISAESQYNRPARFEDINVKTEIVADIPNDVRYLKGHPKKKMKKIRVRQRVK
jgi:hypothetical protein